MKWPRKPLRDSHIKRTGVLVENFEKNPSEVVRPCFVGVAGKFLHPQEVLILTQNISCHIVRLNTLKAPAEDLLRLSTLRDTKTGFLTPKKTPGRGAPPGGGGGGGGRVGKYRVVPSRLPALKVNEFQLLSHYRKDWTITVGKWLAIYKRLFIQLLFNNSIMNSRFQLNNHDYERLSPIKINKKKSRNIKTLSKIN